MSEISIVCPDCADQAGRLCDKIERLQSQLAEAKARIAYLDENNSKLLQKWNTAGEQLMEARKALEPLVTQLREATVYCTEMSALESHCLSVAEGIELLSRGFLSGDEGLRRGH